MAKSDSTFIAIGGGGTPESVIDQIFSLIADQADARVVVMTVATEDATGMTSEYNSMFRKRNVKHVEMVNVDGREDAFDKASIKKLENAHVVYFTGGDQLNVTSLFGGSALHKTLVDRINEGVVIAGTSAGAAMMSGSMMKNGANDTAPKVGGVEIAPGLNLVESTIIDTHFSQRGRHGRLLAALAHYPHNLAIGIDERTAIVVKGKKFEVLGEGSVTVMDGRKMRHTDLVEKEEGQPVALFDACLHVLTSGYSFDLKEREPTAPRPKKAARAHNES